MTRFLSGVLALLIVAANVPAMGAGLETFGAAPTITEETPLAKVIARPADFEKKTVRVGGIVTAVCQMMGCWLALATADSPQGATLLVKVDDGVIVFPTSARGKRATVQGVVERIGGDSESREAAHEHATQGVERHRTRLGGN